MISIFLFNKITLYDFLLYKNKMYDLLLHKNMYNFLLHKNMYNFLTLFFLGLESKIPELLCFNSIQNYVINISL